MLCPLAGGGRGTLEVLLPALGGQTAGATVLDLFGHEIVAGFGLVDGGGTAIVEAAQISAVGGNRGDGGDPIGSSFGVGQLVAAAVDAGAEVIVLACGDCAGCDGGAGAVDAIAAGGGLRGAALVLLCDERTPWERARCGAAGAQRLRELAPRMRRDPRGVPMTAAGGGLAGGLWAQFDAQLVSGPAFVLEELGFDARMRASRALVVGEARLDAGTLAGRVAGEAAIRARQVGVPCHAVAAHAAIAPFDVRILDLQAIVEAAPTCGEDPVAALAAAGERLAALL